MNMNRLGIVSALFLLIGCATSQQEERGLQALMEREKNPGGAQPSVQAPGLRDESSRVPAAMRAPERKQNVNCPSDIETRVRTERGTNCNTYEAEIAGWSIVCVPQCDAAARLAEAVASAQATCAAFCRQKNCPGPRYSPPAQCAISGCLNSSDCDPQQCPLKDRCMLLQGQRVWNCICVDF